MCHSSSAFLRSLSITFSCTLRFSPVSSILQPQSLVLEFITLQILGDCLSHSNFKVISIKQICYKVKNLFEEENLSFASKNLSRRKCGLWVATSFVIMPYIRKSKHSEPGGWYTYHLISDSETLHSPHRVCLCVSYNSHNKMRLFPGAELTNWFL